MPFDYNPKDLGLVTFAAGKQWLRVHGRNYGPTQFNSSPDGNARFSPIKNDHGLIIPTLYAAENNASAIMETVLHDVPSPSAGFIYVPPAIEDRQLATIVNQVPLQLGNLTVMGLRRLGLLGTVVIDGDKPTYGETRDFGQALHAARGDIQGLIWDSRQTKKKSLFFSKTGCLRMRWPALAVRLLPTVRSKASFTICLKFWALQRSDIRRARFLALQQTRKRMICG